MGYRILLERFAILDALGTTQETPAHVLRESEKVADLLADGVWAIDAQFLNGDMNEARFLPGG